MNRIKSSAALFSSLLFSSLLIAGSANAQEKKSTETKLNSIGPAIEFSGGGTSFGIKGRVGVGSSISVRPSILFGYTPDVSGADFSKAVANGAANSLSDSLVARTPAQKRAIIRQLIGAAVTDDQADALIAAAEAPPAPGATRTPAQQALFTALQPVPLTVAEKRTAIKAQPGNTNLTDAQADALLAAAVAKDPADRTLTEQALVDETAPVPLTPEQKQAVVRSQTANAVTDAQADALLAAANNAPAAGRTPEQQDLVDGTANLTTDAAKIEFVKEQSGNATLTDAQALALLAAANQAPVLRTPDQQALVDGTANLTTEAAKIAFVKDQQAPGSTPLTDAQALALLTAANSAPVQRTEEQAAFVDGTKNTVAFNLLTPEQQRAQVRLFSEVTSDKQADEVTTKTSAALAKPLANRTAEENLLVSRFGTTVGAATFAALTPVQKRAAIKGASELTDSQADVIAASLAEAISTPEDTRTTAQQGLLDNTNLAISFATRTEATGFTPGSGVAYGAAVTYDFTSADKKLMGYVGPKVMFASGSSKVGKFDTNTNQTSLGLMLGADYEISPDFTAGLSGTYNFAKSGNLNVSGPGGFKGSSSVSGSSFDVGINFGYRF